VLERVLKSINLSQDPKEHCHRIKHLEKYPITDNWVQMSASVTAALEAKFANYRIAPRITARN